MSEGETITTEKKKHIVTPEHKQKMIEGRKRYWEGKHKEKFEAKEKAVSKPSPEIIIPKGSLKPFGEVDKDVKGNIKSEMPAWYFTEAEEDLGRKIAEGRKALEDDAIPQQAKAGFREALRQKEERLEKIKESKPVLTGKMEDVVKKMNEDMATELREAHPKRSEEEKKLTDAHEEVRRMKDPVIPIKSQEMAEFARECGIRIVDGKISRDSGDKIWKITSKMLGKSTDVEYLRRG